MKKYINDKSPFPQSIEELDGAVLNFEGHDRPRYVYPLNNEAGYLGLDSMDKPWYTPQFVSIDAGGTLTSAKYYSIIVVPIKADISAGGLPIYGEASPYSIPKTPGASSKKITYTIPTHEQFIIKECGIAELFSSFTLTDSLQTFPVSKYVGGTLKNVETGKLYTITANTATTVTATNAIFVSGDRYQILERTVTARAVYSAEMTAAADVSSARFYLRDVINDNTTTAFELTAFAESADEWSFAGNNLPPPNANSVKQLASLVFCGGGISESRGKAKIDTTTANSIQSAEDDTGTVGAISKIEDDKQTFTPDALIGLKLVNNANGAVDITDNTATEIYPALIGTTRFFKEDPYYVLDPTGTPDVSEDATFIPSTTRLTYVDTSTPDESGTATLVPSATTLTYIDMTTPDESTTADIVTSTTIISTAAAASPDLTLPIAYKTTNTITAVNTSATPFKQGLVLEVVSADIIRWGDNTGIPAFSDTVTNVVDAGTTWTLFFASNPLGLVSTTHFGITGAATKVCNPSGTGANRISIYKSTSSIPAIGELWSFYLKDVSSANSLAGKYISNSSSVVGRITSNTVKATDNSPTITAPSHGLTKGTSIKVFSQSYSWATNVYAGKLLYSSTIFKGIVLSNTGDTLTIDRAHGLSIGNMFDIFSGTWTVNEFAGGLLHDGTTGIGFISSNTSNQLVVDRAHGLSAGASFDITKNVSPFTANEFSGAIIHDGATAIGIITSNTNNTLTIDRAHGLSLTNPFDITLGLWTISEHVGKFCLDGSNAILGRITANTQNTLTINAAHGLSATNAFEIHTPSVSSTVTFPTSFKAAGKTWTDDEHAGKIIDFSATANQTILSNNADSIALTGIVMPASAETFSILSASMTISNPYNRSTEAGVEVKIARYTIAGDLADANALPAGTYAGDYATVIDSGNAGNNITSLQIIRVDPNGKWFEVENDSLVVAAADVGTTLTITRNHITGNVSGDDQTYFTEGMVDAQVKFASSGEEVFKITWVDPIGQALGIDELYTDPVTVDMAFEVFSNYPLYYSDSRNPHAFGAANIIDIYDITGFSSVGNSLLVFCKTSLWRVDVESLGAAPVLISDSVRCPAQFSITKGEKVTLFYDGTGISLTDGVSAQSITAYKTRDYLANINKEYESNIRGVYDRENKRFEFVFPMSNQAQNNYGLYVTEDTWNCYPFMRPDCNALWTNYDAGRLLVYHGTSGELEDGDGRVWKHSRLSDADTPQVGVVSAVAGQVITLASEPTCAISDTITIYPATSGGEYFHAIVQAVSGADVTLDSAYDVSGLVAGDLVLFGHIPFDYGIKWTDFASPQYRHQVRAIHIDFSEATGKLYVDHFLDMSETVVSTNEYDLTPATTKIVVPFRMGKSYKYGFRLRGYSSTGIKISSFEIMYDTQV